MRTAAIALLAFTIAAASAWFYDEGPSAEAISWLRAGPYERDPESDLLLARFAEQAKPFYRTKLTVDRQTEIELSVECGLVTVKCIEMLREDRDVAASYAPQSGDYCASYEALRDRAFFQADPDFDTVSHNARTIHLIKATRFGLLREALQTGALSADTVVGTLERQRRWSNQASFLSDRMMAAATMGIVISATNTAMALDPKIAADTRLTTLLRDMSDGESSLRRVLQAESRYMQHLFETDALELPWYSRHKGQMMMNLRIRHLQDVAAHSELNDAEYWFSDPPQASSLLVGLVGYDEPYYNLYSDILRLAVYNLRAIQEAQQVHASGPAHELTSLPAPLEWAWRDAKLCITIDPKPKGFHEVCGLTRQLSGGATPAPAGNPELLRRTEQI